ncbi:MAG: carboxypeptidase regulatory-like domain-containing protein [Alphaproteobacteria bacterium]|nr:carboxypeptidase regulatory-like domain-containing protein [Alphaproteobacteria bacterium]
MTRSPPAPASRPVLLALVPAALLLGACGRTAVDGEVVDVAGAPLEGAFVAAVGTTCSATVGADGRFSMPCTPGEHTLLITHPGYIERQAEVSAVARERKDLGKTVMIAIPEEQGLFLFEADRYVPMAGAWLDRTIVEGHSTTRTRSYCLDRQRSKPTRLAAGTHALFDNESIGWRPFRLDDDGCAYRDFKDEQHRWEVTYKDKPPMQEQTVAEGKRIVALNLAPGEYFLADWDRGFFTPDDAIDADGKRYSGVWLVVE